MGSISEAREIAICIISAYRRIFILPGGEYSSIAILLWLGSRSNLYSSKRIDIRSITLE